MKKPNHLLIRARFLLPMGGKGGRAARIEDGYLFTEGPRIAEAGRYTPEIGARILAACGEDLLVVGAGTGPGDEAVPRLNGALLPGFVKAHGHDHESAIIGVAKDQPLTAWLDNAVNPFTGFLTENAKRLEKGFGRSSNEVAYRKARLDDVSYGITSALTHHCNFSKYHVRELVKANTEAGTRLTIAVGSQDRHYDARILDTPSQAVERVDGYAREFAAVPRVRVIPGPDQFFSNGPEMLKGLKQWARDHGTLIHTHSSEEPGTTRWFVETYGMTEVEYAKGIGFLDGDTILAHQVNCTDRDLEILRDTGVKIVHNPLANTILGSGMPPLIRMMSMGIPVAVSTDGSGSADNQNILNAARLAAQYQKALHQDATLLPAQRMLELITVEPAQMLGLNAGSLEAGRAADFVLIDLRGAHLTPTRIDNVAENLIWASNGSEARWVAAGGELLLDDYRFTRVDASEILADIQRLSELFADYLRTAPRRTGTGAHR
ncbi:MAG TPA: amidohydrolase family protein [bacterium]|jgi:5-methylthioadenosine/S-adenosylhomocysteine deaminase|nr:amidohydrolase family protein [Chlamydiota bacterium]HOE26075.1 amidohydrolase family protein [bacterium]HQM51582.1 amidohydrolase family protein [bacterium]